MIGRFENVKVSRPFIKFSTRRRKGAAGEGRITLEIPIQILAHAADLQRLAESNETFAVSFTRMSEIVRDAEKAKESDG